MKKIFAMLAITVAGGFMLTSCNKDYTCSCSINGAEIKEYSVRASNKNAAEDECNTRQSSLGTTYQCYIQ
ncbi:MAG: hypothetical protein EOP49_28215 [Sphingobacteriales bacterium]|nr:MAG: hypothetical protein EOP49_28215 [Sphingobacteriales bacterium]